MSRRKFIATSSDTALAWPLAASDQLRDKSRAVGTAKERGPGLPPALLEGADAVIE